MDVTEGSELGTRSSSGESEANRGSAEGKRDPRWEAHANAYLSESAPAAPSAASWARRLIGAFAAAAGVRGQRLEDVRLAISEAVSNAVAYAYDDDARG